MAVFCRTVQKCTIGLKNLSEQLVTPITWTGFFRSKYTKPRISEKLFDPKPGDHEKYGGNLEPHKLHLVTRIKSGQRRPYWEKKILHDLGLNKAHQPRVHKNIPAVNIKLRAIKHLIRVQPLKLPQGLPTEEELSETYLKSTGELVIRCRLKPLEQKAIGS
ncbi:39S ribosomal protein L30, mitochondrial [Latimeria chalumnae]|uniref:Large ribosomal subunit protein uL30m n=1 Tax=Latimeria chalumnae TaxID=7897 RepID=H3AXZ8_LATCH|nr:PREDICTED: 39S ribosomal protein L30, mitochondrial [Latimeria chalumnae]XP_006001430.1 PREDICTED: 39S ribosomal protein L30, mitochondrial [Latimeria chalumnae]|eukprot:XP_006001429.1 PREDICTED: 39S ribosomal protein L30, mitochondrial [Latimeria chalumnae]